MMKKIEELKLNGELTEMESQVMDWLLSSGYYAEKWFSDVTFKDLSVATGIPVKQLRGVVGSLVTKKYLFTNYMDDLNETFIHATDLGYQLDDEYEDKWEPEDKLF